MNNPEEKWKSDFQAALSDFEKPGMDLSWEEVETGVKQVKRKRLALYWLGAASVAAVLAIFFVSVFNVSEPVPTEKDPLLASNQKNDPMVEVIGTERIGKELIAEALVASGEDPSAGSVQKAGKPVYGTFGESAEEPVFQTMKRKESIQPLPAEERKKEEKEGVRIEIPEEESVLHQERAADNDYFQEDGQEEEKEKRRRISASIFAGNPWDNSSSVNHDHPILMKAPLYNTQNKEFENEIDRPLLSNATSTNSYERYYQPIRYGISLNIGLTDDLSLGTGLYASLLRSKSGIVYNETHGNEVIQKLWYVGIPLNLNYRFVDLGPFYAYTSIGGMAEMMVSGHQKILELHDGTEEKTRLSGHPWQFSANANVGLGFKIVEDLGLFVEPGVTFYFKNGHSRIQSFYSENRWAFSLNVGLRFHFE